MGVAQRNCGSTAQGVWSMDIVALYRIRHRRPWLEVRPWCHAALASTAQCASVPMGLQRLGASRFAAAEQLPNAGAIDERRHCHLSLRWGERWPHVCHVHSWAVVGRAAGREPHLGGLSIRCLRILLPHPRREAAGNTQHVHRVAHAGGLENLSRRQRWCDTAAARRTRSK